MIAVDSKDTDAGGIKELAILLEIDSNYSIAIVGSLSYGRLAIATVKGNLVEAIFKTNNLITGQGATIRATYI
jgi:hypothetical protein